MRRRNLPAAPCCGAWAAAAAPTLQYHSSTRTQATHAIALALRCPPAVFDVDAEEGAPPRKLALNRGDNPYLVADRWLEEQGLPATYKCACGGHLW